MSAKKGRTIHQPNEKKLANTRTRKERRTEQQAQRQYRNKLIRMSGEYTAWEQAKVLRFRRRHPK